MKKLTVCLVTAILSVFIAVPAFACTGVYVGCDASEDGTSLIARCNDYEPMASPCYVKIFGGKDGEPLKVIKSDNDFVYELPDHIHRFIVIPTCDVVDGQSFYTSAMNDCGVSISATLTGYICPEASNADPYVKGGIVEDMFPAVVGACASNAREGIELIAKIIDEKGSGENNIIMISDQKECWYMEIYGGHQYCAMKAPDDCVCAMGNEFMLETVDENSPDVICSKDLFKLPQEKGYAKYDANGKMNLFNTYSGENRFFDYCHLRTWGAHRLLAPSTAGNYDPNKKYPLFYKPDNKVSVSQVMSIFRDRYQGTEFCPDTNGRKDIRTIADDTQIRTHILQTYKDLPKEIAAVEWLSLSSAEFSTFVPISSAEGIFDPSYTNNISKYENDSNNAYNCYKNLNAVVNQNRAYLGDGVQEYWKCLEDYSINTMPKVLEEAKRDVGNARGLINSFCACMQAQSVYDAKRLKDDVEEYLMQNTRTVTEEFQLFNQRSYNINVEKYTPSYDAVLFAKLFGWNIEENKLQDHPGTYDYSRPGDIKQSDIGGKEGYLKISKNGKTIELHSNNSHWLSKGKLLVDGNETPTYGVLDDGKIYASKEYIDLINTGDTTPIKEVDLSKTRSYEKPVDSIFTAIGSWPVWIQIVGSAALIIILILIGVLIGRKTR